MGLASNVNISGGVLGTRTWQLEATEKARRKKCDVRFSFARGNRVFQKNQNEDWCEGVVEDGLGEDKSR